VYYGRLALASRVRRGNCLPERSFFVVIASLNAFLGYFDPV